MVIRIANKLDRFDTRSSTASIDTSRIIDECQAEEIDEESDDNENSLNNNKLVSSVVQNRFNESSCLKNISRSSKPHEYIANEHFVDILNNFKSELKAELIVEIRNLLNSDFSSKFENQCSKVIDQNKNISKDVKKISDMLDVSKKSAIEKNF